MPQQVAQSKKPLGSLFLEHVGMSPSREQYKAMVLVLTFLAYASYHATRKTTSVVKSVLDPKTQEFESSLLWAGLHFPAGFNYGLGEEAKTSGWAPFNGPNGSTLLGVLDLGFLSVYAVGMFFAGYMGDRLDLRILLTIGMAGTALFTALFGAGYWLSIHSFGYFLLIQLLAGLFQSSGWPSLVAVVGNWFGKEKRGLIMGIWNSHTSVGNICGSLLASLLLKYGWGWSFAAPALLVALVGLAVFLFLPVSPQVVGAPMPPDKSDTYATVPLLREGAENGGEHDAVGFLEAWRIPGVAPFALCLFFCKLVVYTFLYWLPFYISQTAIDGRYLSDSGAGYLSIFFDVGGIAGGVIAGHISDRLDARALTAASFMYCAIPALLLYRVYGSISLYWNITLMFISGMFVNGPYALITTAVSADLGTHSSLRGNVRALATVTAIIDGTGSIGATVGPLLTGYISALSWTGVFLMLMLSLLVAGLLLTKLVIAEVQQRVEVVSRSHHACDVSRPTLAVASEV